MGTIQKGILGGVSGKVGPVVGCRWKSKFYLRAQAARTSNPRTPEQQTQRGKFATAFAFLQGVKPFIRIGYRECAQEKSAFNAAMSYLLKKAVAVGEAGAEIDFRRVLVSIGCLMPALEGEVTVSSGQAQFVWTDNSGLGNAEETDTAMLLVYNLQRKEAVYTTQGALRRDGCATLPLPQNWEQEPLAAYLSFCDAEGEGMSNSLFLPVSTATDYPSASANLF